MNGQERIAQLGGDLRDLQARVGRIVATVVEEVTDVMRAEHVDQPLVLRARFVEPLELVAARAERAGRCAGQCPDVARGLLPRVDQVLGQRTDDAVAPGEHAADLRAVGPRRLDDARGAGVDDGGDAAGLCVERVAGCHGQRSCSVVGDVSGASARARLRREKRVHAGRRARGGSLHPIRSTR